ncbi:MAG TPA: hypothetical protein ENF73_01655, partial [Proteobacteria bacterium]|nr:hypothetical protein [Pseudomonadota bacterium]
MKGRWLVALALIVAASAAVRTANLGTNPPGLFTDEAAAIFDARSLLETGRDMWGERFPLFFRSLGDYNSGFHRYLMVPLIAILGNKIYAARLASALVSIATVVICLFIGMRLGGERAGVLCAMFVGFSPWSIMYARVAQEQSLLPLFLAIIVWAYLAWRDSEPRFYRDLSLGALFALAFYSYQPARVLIPALFAGFVLLEIRTLGFRRALHMALGFALVLTPALHFFILRPQDFLARAR